MKRVNPTVAIHRGKTSQVLAHGVREHNKIRQTMKKVRQRKEYKAEQTTGRCCEEYDARRSERKGKVAIARGASYVLKKN